MLLLRKKYFTTRRVLVVVLVITSCILFVATPSRRSSKSSPVKAAPAVTICSADPLWKGKARPKLPPGRYLYSVAYGWFDARHFDSGNPDQVIADVRAAAARGGGIISLRQDVRGGLTGYTGHYLISGDVTEKEVIGVALGIYMDWSGRFEAWQGRPPRSIVGPLTAFSIEDLPSHYVGFFARATGMENAEVFACYLGEVEGTDITPPHLLFYNEADPATPTVPRVRHLVNTKFTPLVLTREGWRNVGWPNGMQLVPIDSSSGLWHFEQEETWYFEE
jgi:hypothetical protein